MIIVIITVGLLLLGVVFSDDLANIGNRLLLNIMKLKGCLTKIWNENTMQRQAREMYVAPTVKLRDRMDVEHEFDREESEKKMDRIIRDSLSREFNNMRKLNFPNGYVVYDPSRNWLYTSKDEYIKDNYYTYKNKHRL